MKTLRDYVLKATNYLYPTQNAERQNMEREKFIKFCEIHGLADEFIRLVENDPKWSELASHETVQYFVDVPKYHSVETKQDLPQIKLIACELGKVPAIKVVCERDFL